MKQNASLDTSFWINCYRIGILHYVFEYFNIFANREVMREILYPIAIGIVSEDAHIFKERLNQEKIIIKNPVHTTDIFHMGESLAIVLSEENDFVLLIDNGAPYNYAKSKNIKVVCSPMFVVFLFSQGKIKYSEAKLKLRELKKYIKDNIINESERILTILKEIGGE